MLAPNSISYCAIIKNEIISSLYDVKCTLKGEDTCSDESEIDFTVGNNEPEPHMISDTNLLYYLNFFKQSTIDKTIRYYLNGGILSKKSVDKIITFISPIRTVFSGLMTSINNL